MTSGSVRGGGQGCALPDFPFCSSMKLFVLKKTTAASWWRAQLFVLPGFYWRYGFVIEFLRDYTSGPVLSRPRKSWNFKVFQWLAAISAFSLRYWPRPTSLRAPHRNRSVKSNRPVNLSLSTVLAVNLKSPVAIASILHRISGVLIFLLIPVLLYVLQESLASEQAFSAVKTDVLGGLIGGFLVFVALAGLIFHIIVGGKHLVQDFGVGESLQGGRLFAWLALAAAAFFIVVALAWMVL